MNSVLAISSVVIKELYRRKDFYVLFVLTALITVGLGFVNFFNDDAGDGEDGVHDLKAFNFAEN